MYEAAGNLLWCNPYAPIDGTDAVIAGDPLVWSDVVVAADAFFSIGACKSNAETPGNVGRILFPTSVCVHVEGRASLNAAEFKGSLRLLSGHLLVTAWYLAMFKALTSPAPPQGGAPADGEWGSLVVSLWQCCLTVTIHCRVGMSLQEQAVLSISLSETRRTMLKLTCESFLSFALKALLVISQTPAASRLGLLNGLGVRFSNSPVSKPMMAAIMVFDEKMTPRAIETLRRIERKYGQEVLTHGYTKLLR
jgi:hypothetical protein